MSELFLIQARKRGGRYRTIDTQRDLPAAAWSMRQYDVGLEPWVSSGFRVIDAAGKVYLRSTPKSWSAK